MLEFLKSLPKVDPIQRTIVHMQEYGSEAEPFRTYFHCLFYDTPCDPKFVKKISSLGYNKRKPDPRGADALKNACANKSIANIAEIIDVLLLEIQDVNVLINLPDPHKQTPLHYALYDGSSKAVEKLLQLGATINDSSMIPFYLRAAEDQDTSEEIIQKIQLLMKHGKPDLSKTNQGETAIQVVRRCIQNQKLKDRLLSLLISS